eukprot:6178928-Pleurochrysis_carterae.AAC.1
MKVVKRASCVDLRCRLASRLASWLLVGDGTTAPTSRALYRRGAPPARVRSCARKGQRASRHAHAHEHADATSTPTDAIARIHAHARTHLDAHVDGHVLRDRLARSADGFQTCHLRPATRPLKLFRRRAPVSQGSVCLA